MNRKAGAAKTDGLIRGLEPAYYTDPAIFERERERIFYRTWQHACHVSDVESSGDYVVFEIADQSLFVIRDGEGGLRCFYNVCQHRAHHLLQGAGTCRKIVCPYHAWAYELDGRLVGAPNSKAVPGFDVSEICLSEVGLEVFCGFVFVNLDRNAAPMDMWYPGARAALQARVPKVDQYSPIWTHEAEELCNWKVAVENYNECYHCKHVHRAFTTGVIDPLSVDIVPDGYTLRHSGRAAVGDSVAYEFDDAAYGAIYFWPTMSVQIYPGRVVNTYYWRTNTYDLTIVYRSWLTLNGNSDPETMGIAEIDRDTTFAEDIPLVNSVQRGLASRGYRPGPLIIDPAGGVASELSVHTFHNWVREALDEA
ncbi:MAG: aromatic ring-hydroxylating dioxygenase subunit alpha [Alphaproteobacteria bacterium]|nr:aromatic ring-hydroxylating dioxygenase subunit alpha [Alphaproteobacteria bacterium]